MIKPLPSRASTWRTRPPSKQHQKAPFPAGLQAALSLPTRSTKPTAVDKSKEWQNPAHKEKEKKKNSEFKQSTGLSIILMHSYPREKEKFQDGFEKSSERKEKCRRSCVAPGVGTPALGWMQEDGLQVMHSSTPTAPAAQAGHAASTKAV